MPDYPNLQNQTPCHLLTSAISCCLRAAIIYLYRTQFNVRDNSMSTHK